MRAFSQLLDDLVYTRSRNTKLKLIGDYLKETPDPDRGYGLAALTGTLDIPHVKPAAIRFLVNRTANHLSRASPYPPSGGDLDAGRRRPNSLVEWSSLPR